MAIDSAKSPALQVVRRDRLSGLLKAPIGVLLKMLPGQFLPFRPVLESNMSALVARLVALPDDELVLIVDRLRWELRQIRDPDDQRAAPMTYSEAETRAFQHALEELAK